MIGERRRRTRNPALESNPASKFFSTYTPDFRFLCKFMLAATNFYFILRPFPRLCFFIWDILRIRRISFGLRGSHRSGSVFIYLLVFFLTCCSYYPVIGNNHARFKVFPVHLFYSLFFLSLFAWCIIEFHTSSFNVRAFFGFYLYISLAIHIWEPYLYVFLKQGAFKVFVDSKKTKKRHIKLKGLFLANSYERFITCRNHSHFILRYWRISFFIHEVSFTQHVLHLLPLFVFKLKV